ncbi:MAG: terminase large subunit [Burkholderiaceae bacterium]|nr:terminase large subunit [Burkholderiaceae bacterium]
MNSYAERARAYADRVVRGEEVAGKFERLACQRFIDDLARQGTEEFPYRFDEAAGARCCRFLELLPHIKGQWARPEYVDGRLRYAKLKLEDWQVFIVMNVIGWLHQVTGLRRFRRVYEEVARKNAKSTLAAGLLLFCLLADAEPGAQVYSAATTGDQARLVFDDARHMALREPELIARFGVTVGMHDITVPTTASSAKPLNAEGSTLDGLNIHAAIVDELHAHKTRAVYDVLDTATGARSQPLIVMITTAGSDRSGICYEQRGYTVKVLERTVVDETWFGIIFTIDEGDLWHDPAVWRKANPNYGISVLESDMEAACRKAQAMPSAQANFLTKRMNVWVNADSAWMGMQAWERCADRELTPASSRNGKRLGDLPCYLGLDLASKVDVAAKVRLFYDADIDHYYLIPTFWLPERAIEQGRNSQYDGWRRAGRLLVTDGEVIDFDAIEDDIRADVCMLQVAEIPFDPWQATQLASHLLEDGAPMVEFRQTVQNMSEPMKMLEALTLQGKLTHDGNPAMTWMVSNVVCHRDAKDNIYPRKERDENKIDGAVAAIMALGRCLAGGSQGKSFWETLST